MKQPLAWCALLASLVAGCGETTVDSAQRAIIDGVKSEADDDAAVGIGLFEIGRAACRERV